MATTTTHADEVVESVCVSYTNNIQPTSAPGYTYLHAVLGVPAMQSLSFRNQVVQGIAHRLKDNGYDVTLGCGRDDLGWVVIIKQVANP